MRRAWLAGVAAVGMLWAGWGGWARGQETVQKVFDPEVDGTLWPKEPQEPRVQFLMSISTPADLKLGRAAAKGAVAGGVEEKLGIKKPYGVRIINGTIYVCDVSNPTITVLDLRKQEVRTLGAAGEDPGQKAGEGALVKPLDIAIAPDGHKYVADAKLDAVVEYDAKDRYVRTIQHENLHCGAVAVYKDELYIGNLRSYQVEVYDRTTGKLVRTIGAKGKEDGQFLAILGVAVDKDGNVYTTDLLNCRVTKFDHEGKFVLKIGAQADREGGFVRPKHLAVDSEGQVYVVDAAFQNVQVFDKEGKVLYSFGGNGDYAGAMDMPAGIAITEEPGDVELFKPFVRAGFEVQRLVIVANQFGEHKISVYGVGQMKRGAGATRP